MSRNSPVPIRFDEAVREELESLSRASGLSLSDLCRLAVEKFLDEVALTGSVSLRVSERPEQRYGVRPVHRSAREVQPLDGGGFRSVSEEGDRTELEDAASAGLRGSAGGSSQRVDQALSAQAMEGLRREELKREDVEGVASSDHSALRGLRFDGDSEERDFPL